SFVYPFTACLLVCIGLLASACDTTAISPIPPKPDCTGRLCEDPHQTAHLDFTLLNGSLKFTIEGIDYVASRNYKYPCDTNLNSPTQPDFPKCGDLKYTQTARCNPQGCKQLAGFTKVTITAKPANLGIVSKIITAEQYREKNVDSSQCAKYIINPDGANP